MVGNLVLRAERSTSLLPISGCVLFWPGKIGNERDELLGIDCAQARPRTVS